MQKINKIWLFIMFFFMSITVCQAKTDNLNLENEIGNSKYMLRGVEQTNITKIMDTTTNEPLYTIKPDITISEGSYTEYKTFEELDINLSSEQLDFINRIAYYGYLYNTKRSDDRWYAITQLAIWDYMLDDDISFKDASLNEDVKLLLDDASTVDIKPSFVATPELYNGEHKYGSSITLVDENNILEKFDFQIDDGLDYTKEGNTLTINFTSVGSFGAHLTRKTSWFKPQRIFYKSNTDYAISRGEYKHITCDMSFSVPHLTLKITRENTTSLSLAGAVYELHQVNGLNIHEETMNEKGEMVFIGLVPDEYYLIEKETVYGFKKNPEKIYFSVFDDTEGVIPENAILKTINIESYLNNIDNTLGIASQSKFEIYAANSHKLIKSLTTDEMGKCSVSLPYGDYILKEISTNEGYIIANNQSFSINENTLDNTSLKVLNNQIKGSLKLQIKENNNLLKTNLNIKIKDLNTNNYLKLNKENTFTIKDGILELNNIPYGEYEIIIEDNLTGYNLINESLNFQIKEMDSKEQIDLVYEVINIPDIEESLGNIDFTTTDAYSFGPIPNIVFGIYNENRELLYEVTTDKEGKAYLNNIPIGNYYIKEIAVPNNYDIDERELTINVKGNETIHVEVTKKDIIEVPKTATYEFYYLILISGGLLCLGLILYNYGKNY